MLYQPRYFVMCHQQPLNNDTHIPVRYVNSYSSVSFWPRNIIPFEMIFNHTSPIKMNNLTGWKTHSSPNTRLQLLVISQPWSPAPAQDHGYHIIYLNRLFYKFPAVSPSKSLYIANRLATIRVRFTRISPEDQMDVSVPPHVASSRSFWLKKSSVQNMLTPECEVFKSRALDRPLNAKHMKIEFLDLNMMTNYHKLLCCCTGRWVVYHVWYGI